MVDTRAQEISRILKAIKKPHVLNSKGVVLYGLNFKYFNILERIIDARRSNFFIDEEVIRLENRVFKIIKEMNVEERALNKRHIKTFYYIQHRYHEDLQALKG